MKMIFAIINRDDAGAVMNELTRCKIPFTRLSSNGGFLGMGNVTIMIGIKEERAQEAIDVITKYSHSRKQLITPPVDMGMGLPTPIEVVVGGATIFVVDVERFEKV